MRVIRPSSLNPTERRRAVLLACSMLSAGIIALQVAMLAPPIPMTTGVLAASAALGIGIGSAWLLRAVRPNRTRRLGTALIELLGPAFDDTYTLLVAPRLPVRDAQRLDGVLVGPAGVRVLTARDWQGRYRVRGRVWEFDARGARGWIRCRTNPSFDAVGLADGFTRWASGADLGDLPVKPAVAFPLSRSSVVLEEPADEIVTGDNAPWWANTIGRVRRLDPAVGARVIQSILDAADREVGRAPRRIPDRVA